MRKIILVLFIGLFLVSCSPMVLSRLNSKTMGQLELGMSKEEMTEILGNNYTIPERRREGQDDIEVLSYRNYPYTDEFYQFVFVNGTLHEWYRELLPSYELNED
ncbi:hypothetical protein PBT90_10225 [Algoriphagus halophytocola]|uniref:Lipoprotein SmpA/OmlA domain-containing protein n=1 Tax=Algoriphagus halophytocola TaxID=2991499 RepID=A0ABY6MJU0_9BACT|nr:MULTISPECIES: hypothetical protein [unclassified Algoriphagus]UZD23764.1 hypothetical protein OM944_04555 [Algoriphagus sp. TR-M5]WBL45058.1 hypothetical protein PBT90_10225 [Algoriphagus sp. TR-M9]